METNIEDKTLQHVGLISIVDRFDIQESEKIIALNRAIKHICRRNQWTFIDNDNIDKSCLWRDGLHLNQINWKAKACSDYNKSAFFFSQFSRYTSPLMTSHSTVDKEAAPLAHGRSPGLIKQGLQMAHLNIRSIMCKFDEVKQILYDNETGIIGFTETHLRNEISDVEIDICGYMLDRRDRTLNDGHGGVLLYVKKSFKLHQKK